MSVLVTGGTGFLGQYLVDAILKSPRFEGETVRIFCRARPHTTLFQPTAGEKSRRVEWVTGSLLNPADVSAACRSVSKIFHVAGMVSREPRFSDEMYRLHVDGTRVLLQSAESNGVERMVAVSTSGTTAVSTDPMEVSDETAPYREAVVRRWPYYLSKIYQERLALNFAQNSRLEVVTVLPSILFGPHDLRLSSTLDLLRFIRKQIMVCPKGGFNFIDVRDAADAVVVAMQEGRSNERYLLGGENMTFEAFFARLSRITGLSKPRLKLPERGLRLSTRAMELVYELANRPKPFDEASADMASHFWYVNSNKARRTLRLLPREPGETLIETVRDLSDRYGIALPALRDS